MKAMQYKGYAARIEYGDKDGRLVGHVAGIKDIVGLPRRKRVGNTCRFCGGRRRLPGYVRGNGQETGQAVFRTNHAPGFP